MNENQMQEVQKTFLQSGAFRSAISILELENQKPRTLVYGYTIERDSFHVYIKNDLIHLYIYDCNGNEVFYHQGDTHYADTLIPDKRTYPESCDFEFMNILASLNISPNFTTYGHKKSPKHSEYEAPVRV